MNLRRSRAGFTLVEMLVVIGIIAVLVAILVPGVISAVNAARRNQMATEVAQLADALNAYKNQFGDYPPSMGGGEDYTNPASTVVERHLRKCFPKMTAAEKTNFYTNIAPKMQQGEALVSWLNGLSKDPRLPFTGSGDKYKFFPFDETRFVDTDGDSIFAYKTKYAKDTSYIYMDARYYNGYATNTVARSEGNDTTPDLQVLPYFSTATKAVNATTFQIICAGLDGEFSQGVTTQKLFPSGAGYDMADRDNITNFAEGRTLFDSIP